MARDVHVAVLAGGSGTRFWPLSRELSPKQMLQVFQGQSLLTQAVRRAAALTTGDGQILVVVGPALLDETRNHLTSQPDLRDLPVRYVVEPAPRNTAPALALAAATLKNVDPDGTLIMMPADHLIQDGEEFDRAMAAAVLRARTGDIVTIGMVPTEAATGFGYIKMGQELIPATGAHLAVHRADRFVEKPDIETARQYLADGNYLWNSGMVVATPRAILKQLRAVSSTVSGLGDVNYVNDGYKIAGAAEMVADMGDDAYLHPAAQHIFSGVPSVPFDTAVLELSQVVSVVPATFGWSDVGSLTALDDLGGRDERGNCTIGRGVQVDCTDTLTYSSDRLVATLGLEDIVVVDTADATLVAARSHLQDVRKVVEALKEMGAPELIQPKTSLRPWGSWTMLMRGPGYQIKEITVLPGSRLSLQSHEQRVEHWVVVAGVAHVELDGQVRTVETDESVFIPAGAKHRLANESDGELHIVEVATGAYLGEDDITRYEDDFGR